MRIVLTLKLRRHQNTCCFKRVYFITDPTIRYIYTHQLLTKIETQGQRVVAHSLLCKRQTQGEGDTTVQTHRNIEQKPKLSRDYLRYSLNCFRYNRGKWCSIAVLTLIGLTTDYYYPEPGCLVDFFCNLGMKN